MDSVSKFFEWMIAGDITPSEVILNTLLVIFGIAIIVSLIRSHRGNGPYKNFNLIYLIVNSEGFPDGAKVVEIGTFFLLAWGFVVYVTGKTLPEWYMQWFLIAFVLRGAYGAYLRSKGGPEMPLGTTTVTQTAIKTTEVTPQAPPIAPASSSIAAKDVTVKAAGEVNVERDANFAEPSKGKKP